MFKIMIHRIKSVLTEIGFCAKDVESVSQDIFNVYTSAERCYHNINHIFKMLNNFDDFIQCSGCTKVVKNIKEFAFAIIMHDYIHGTTDDVNKSAQQAKDFLHKISLEYDTEYVEKLIRATDYNKYLKTDFDEQLMQDLDLNTLGADYAEYSEYSNQIRCEYIRYPDSIFYKERIKVLNTFLNRRYIFNTEYYRKIYEQAARNNIAKELSKIVAFVD
jgi:predicted metal-dependent HD superfamily phosphohydrolase